MEATVKDLEEQGFRIRKAREWIDYSQGELAEKLQAEGVKISTATISRIEDGQRDVWDHEMDVLVVLLEQPRDWLAGRIPFDQFNPLAKNRLLVMGLTTHQVFAEAA